jgi:hypothetical protein
MSWETVLITSVSDPHPDKWVQITASRHAFIRSILISILVFQLVSSRQINWPRLVCLLTAPIHATYAAPSLCPVFDKPIRWKAQITQLLTTHFLQLSAPPLSITDSHTVLKTPWQTKLNINEITQCTLDSFLYTADQKLRFITEWHRAIFKLNLI